MLLNQVIAATGSYIEQMPKTKRKKYGQFFTSKATAIFMSKLFNLPDKISNISVLDPGAGSGILACALLDRINECLHIKRVELTCYETDVNIIDILKNNLDYYKANVQFKLEYHIITENYLISQYQDFNGALWSAKNSPKYDVIIGNPPYKKIPKDAPEATAMPEVCYGAPNLYFLFAAMSAFNLRPTGEMVYIIPRSWTSGSYFRAFRNFFLSECKLQHIHLFISRDKVFDKENVLQETMIIKVQKTASAPENVVITSSASGNDFEHLSELAVPYNLVVAGKDKYVYLVTDKKEMNVLKKLHRWNYTLPDLGLRMKTGLTVDFRNRQLLRDTPEDGALPLFFSQHIKEGVVKFPINKEHEYIVTEQSGLLQENKNYLFVKRFTAKEEKRRLQCGIYLAKFFPNYSHISTQNKINFIDGVLADLSEYAVYGLYVLLNSTLYDMYYRILNGSTQVNSTEVNSMPVPDLETIKSIGRSLMKSKDLSEENCNRILEGYCG